MGTLNVGDAAPDFHTTTDKGETASLATYAGKRVVIYFYPKDDTPGCTIQACSFRDSYAEIKEKNAVVLGVSPDGVASHEKFRDKFELPFTLLVDEDHAIADAYGVWGEKTSFGKTSVGIIRSQFVIDEAGKLVAVNYKISPNDSVPEALKVL